jgi:hypothetical protein
VVLSLLAVVVLMLGATAVYDIHQTHGGFGLTFDLGVAVVVGGLLGLAAWSVTGAAG